MTSIKGTKGFRIIRQLQKRIKSPSDTVLYDFMTVMEYFNADVNNQAIIGCRDGWVSTFNKVDSLDQFDTTHVNEFNQHVDMYPIEQWRFFEVQTGKYDDIGLLELTHTSAVSIVTEWDSLAERITSPDNEGKYIQVGCEDTPKYQAELHTRLAHIVRTSHEHGTFQSLKRCFTYLSSVNHPRNIRLTVFPSYQNDEIDFVLQRINRKGEWNKVFNGGIILHGNNKWSTHT
jgi:hypothetical protein